MRQSRRIAIEPGQFWESTPGRNNAPVGRIIVIRQIHTNPDALLRDQQILYEIVQVGRSASGGLSHGSKGVRRRMTRAALLAANQPLEVMTCEGAAKVLRLHVAAARDALEKADVTAYEYEGRTYYRADGVRRAAAARRSGPAGSADAMELALLPTALPTAEPPVIEPDSIMARILAEISVAVRAEVEAGVYAALERLTGPR